MGGKTGAHIVIRCTEEERVRLKQAAAAFGGYRKAFNEFLRVYEEHPQLFKTILKRRVSWA